MREIVSISVGAAATGLIAREHTLRSRAERLGAATMETLLNAIDANDEATGAHVRRVAAYALILGEAAGLDDRMLHSVERIVPCSTISASSTARSRTSFTNPPSSLRKSAGPS